MHLVKSPPTQPSDDKALEAGYALIDRLIEEAASAQRDNREKDARIKRLEARIEELEQELDLADTAVDYYQRRDW